MTRSLWLCSALLGASLLTPALSQAQEGLHVYNHATKASTVRVTSGLFAGKCVGDRLFTAPNSEFEINWNQVDVLCYDQFDPYCTAEVYLGDSHDCGDGVGSDDVKIGTVGLDSKGNVTVLTTEAGHSISGGANQLTVDK